MNLEIDHVQNSAFFVNEKKNCPIWHCRIHFEFQLKIIYNLYFYNLIDFNATVPAVVSNHHKNRIDQN